MCYNHNPVWSHMEFVLWRLRQSNYRLQVHNLTATTSIRRPDGTPRENWTVQKIYDTWDELQLRLLNVQLYNELDEDVCRCFHIQVTRCIQVTELILEIQHVWTQTLTKYYWVQFKKRMFIQNMKVICTAIRGQQLPQDPKVFAESHEYTKLHWKCIYYIL